MDKQDLLALGINHKGLWGQILCKHKDTQWFAKTSTTGFFSLGGEQRVQICKNCGKMLGEYVAEYEGNGFK